MICDLQAASGLGVGQSRAGQAEGQAPGAGGEVLQGPGGTGRGLHPWERTAEAGRSVGSGIKKHLTRVQGCFFLPQPGFKIMELTVLISKRCPTLQVFQGNSTEGVAGPSQDESLPFYRHIPLKAAVHFAVNLLIIVIFESSSLFSPVALKVLF